MSAEETRSHSRSDSTPEPTPDLVDEVDEATDPAEADARANGSLPEKWDIADYLPGGNSMAGAKKLSDSAVAPLVAMARGYETVHEDGYADAAKRYAFPSRQSVQGRRFADAVSRGDLLIMPWFTADDVELAARSNSRPKPATVQIRPAKPDVNAKGKEIKYEFVGGRGSPIGMHPGFPVDWIDHTPAVLLAEGLLKGDSAHTAYLLAHGVSRDELAWTEDDHTGSHAGDVMAARGRLTGLMDRIPADDRLLVLTIGGVDNWKNNAEWRSLVLSGRQVWLGIDGDVSTNPNVYRAASELWEYLTAKKKSRPMLLAPTVDVPDDEETRKIGIDDYLADYGDWNDLVELLSTSLPSRPSGTQVEFIGEHRISEDGTRLQKCEAVPDPKNPDGPPVRGRWEDVLPLGGRIVSLVSHRSPTPAEMATGILDDAASSDVAEEEVEVELKWVDPDDEKKIHRRVVTGPARILNYAPDLWAREKAKIPAAVLRMPEWPPRAKDGEAWLRAMKSHRADEQQVQVRWETMGWAPTPAGRPAFIVGDQVIGEEDNPEADIFAGVSEGELAGASRFGVGEDDGDLDDGDYCAKVRRDIEKTIERFVQGGAWTDRRVASTVVAAALRPALPIRPKAVVFCWGPPRKGKSWSAAMMMGFWSRHPGDFTDSSLPGSANDTAAALETSVARPPIWVVDDLAPSTSRMRSEQGQSKIEELVRNVHNGTSKKRNDVNMGSRKTFPPRALLVITAENLLGVGSAVDRTISLAIGWGALSQSRVPTDEVSALCYRDGAPARVTQALIKYIRWCAKNNTDGWAGLYDEVCDTHRVNTDAAEERIKEVGGSGNPTRHAVLAGDVAASLTWLHRLADHVGVRDEIKRLLLADEMIDDIFSLVGEGHAVSRNASPGHDLVEALADVLYRGRAHVRNALHPSQPPGDEDTAVMLGWDVAPDDRSRGKGDTIGHLVDDPKHGPVIYFDQRAAFAVAQKECPSLIRPGQGWQASWGSVVGEGFTVDELRRPGKDGKLLGTGRRRDRHVANPVAGTPIRLSTILARGEHVDDE